MKKGTAALWICLSAVFASVLTAVAFFCFASVFSSGRRTQAADDVLPVPTLPTEEGELYDEKKLDELGGILNTYFIGDIDRNAMTETLAAAMVEGIDDRWSYYIPADEYSAYEENVNNSYVGIGVTISWENEDPRGFLVTDVTPDSPAYHAGIMIGDYMKAVEGVDVTELGMAETRNRVRGEEGTDVTVTVEHDGIEKELTITRASIKVVNVTYELLGDEIGYLHIRNFETDCAKDAIAAIEELQANGAKALIFDVRFNPGGLKREMVTLLDYLLPEGPLFRSIDYSGNENVDYSDERHLELPMAVLVNVDSYSAAEFFAAALQEYEAATVIGTQTFGKGHFQTCIKLSDGSAVNLSIGKYTTPNGVSLVGTGITPDHVIELSDEEYSNVYYGKLAAENDPQLQDAIKTVQAQIR